MRSGEAPLSAGGSATPRSAQKNVGVPRLASTEAAKPGVAAAAAAGVAERSTALAWK
jgi:hypothetical protein